MATVQPATAQPATHRQHSPHRQGPQTSPQFSSASSGASVSSAARHPQFSGLFSSQRLTAQNKLVSVFKNIDEKFLIQFLALDLVAFWLTRVTVGLFRGRERYDVRQDPTMQGQPLPAQVKKSVTENVKGLNWPNFAEEFEREGLTGPGMLVVPGVLYALARKSYGKQGIMLSDATLRQLNEGFQAHLQNTAVNRLAASTPDFADQVQQEATVYLRNLLRNPDFNKLSLQHLVDSKNRHLLDPSAPGALKPEAVFQHHQIPVTNKMTMDQYLDQWFEKWGKALFNDPKSTATFEADLKELLVDYYNQSYVMNQQLANANTTSLMNSEKLLLSNGEKQTLGGFFQNAQRWRDIVQQLITDHGKQGEGRLLSETVQNGLKKTVSRKGIYALSAAVLTTAYLTILNKWIQSHDSYPGERGNQHAAAPGSQTQAQTNSAQQALPTGPAAIRPSVIGGAY